MTFAETVPHVVLVAWIVALLVFVAIEPAVSLALAVGAAGLFLGFGLGGSDIEFVLLAGAIGASAGVLVGGLAGAAIWRRWRRGIPRRTVIGGAVALGVWGVLASSAAPLVVERSCREPRYSDVCSHLGAILALVPLNVGFLVALVLVLGRGRMDRRESVRVRKVETGRNARQGR